jgi:hypothetical protein
LKVTVSRRPVRSTAARIAATLASSVVIGFSDTTSQPWSIAAMMYWWW